MTGLAQADAAALPMAAGMVDLIFTDPPYARQYLYCYEFLAREAARVLKPGGFVLAMCGGLYLNQIFRMFDDAGLTYFWKYEVEMTAWQGCVIRPHGDATIQIVSRSKPILAYSKGTGSPRTPSLSVVSGNGKDKKYHAWGQDVESARYFIDCFSAPGDLVLDPFTGGGTGPVACELIGRRWIGFDIGMKELRISRDRLSGADIPYRLPLFAGMAL